jgi:hypoxanthine phosphoribosyltransferase
MHGEVVMVEHPAFERVIISAAQIEERVSELAAQISEEYAQKQPLYLIGILKGAFIFLADLCRRLTIPHVVDFMALSSYGNSVESGAVRIVMDLRESIEGRHVILVEDIVDTGRTLAYLHKTLIGRRAASLKTCVLLQKDRIQTELPADYLGFKIPDVWVVGYGLDYAETYRTLPYIAELKQSVYS